MKIKKEIQYKILKLILIFALLTPIYFILYKILQPRASAFGCFDDCFNYMGGYFMLDGKTLYSQIFFNHQRLMADISYLIQTLLHPVNIYDLVLKHRQFVLIISFIMNGLIIYRFGIVGVGFALFYEFSKFYIFGDRFLAEGIVVYFLVYMIGLMWNKLNNKKITFTDYIISGFFAWLVLFLREPYALVVLAIYASIMAGKSQYRQKVVSLILLTLLSLFTIIALPLKEYFFSVFTVNKTILSQDISSNNLFMIFFYPVFLYFNGFWNLFRQLLLGINTLFLIMIIFYLKQYGRFRNIFILLLMLGLANLRPVPQGLIFYESFHLLPWYGMFIFATFLLIKENFIYYKKVVKLSIFLLISLFLYFVTSPKSYISEKIDSHSEYLTNFGKIIQIGEVVRSLSSPKDTLFLDGEDDLIYWQAKLDSSYKYSWYTSFMPRFHIYTDERISMFYENPPDFYYDLCTKLQALENNSSLPLFVKNKYLQLYSDKKPTCLYIKKTKLTQISEKQWEKAKEFNYDPPQSLQ